MQFIDWQGFLATAGLALVFLVAWRLRDFHYEPPRDLYRDDPDAAAPGAGGDAHPRRGKRRPPAEGEIEPLDPAESAGSPPDGDGEGGEGEDGESDDTTYLPDLGEEATPFERCLVGWCFINGIDVPWDLEEAVSWIREEAERGHPEARYVFALCLRRGDGVPRNERDARKWLRLAAPEVPEAADLLRDAYGEEPPPPKEGG